MVGRYSGPFDDSFTDIGAPGIAVVPQPQYPSVPDGYTQQPRSPVYPYPVAERHAERFANHRPLAAAVAAGAAAGTVVYDGTLAFRARTLTIFNDSDVGLYCAQLLAIIPAKTYNYVLRCEPTLDEVRITTSTAATTGGAVYIRPSELEQEVTAISPSSGSGGSSTNATIVGPLGQAAMAASVPVVIASNQSTVPVSGAITANAGTGLNTSLLALETGGNLGILAGIVSGAKAAIKSAAGDIVDLATLLTRVPAALTAAGWFQTSIRGAANINTNQQTSTAAAVTLLIARATRKRAVIENTDATNAVWIGPATVTAANGMKIPAEQSIEVTWTGLVQIIDNGSHAVVTFMDEYD